MPTKLVETQYTTQRERKRQRKQLAYRYISVFTQAFT